MNTISNNQSDPKPRDDFATLAVIDDEAMEKISGGLIGPDQDLNDIPRLLWPVVRPVDLVYAQPQPQPSRVADNLKSIYNQFG